MDRLDVQSLGRLGDGLAAAADGGRVVVPGAVPGDVVEGAVEGGRMAAPRLERPSPRRVAPVCPHAGRCGGCAVQHADDALLAEWKTAMLREALAAQGLTPPLRPIHVSPPGARRRVAFSARRTRKGVLLGFHGRASAEIVDVASCAVADQAIMAASPALRAAVAAAASRSGAVRVTVVASEAGLDVALDGAKPPDLTMRARLAEIAEAADFARLSVNGEPLAARRPPAHRFGRALATPAPGGFLQATRDGEEALVAAAREALAGARAVADLFCGCGAFALRLAEDAAVLAADGDAAAVAALEAGWRGAAGLRPLRAQTRDLMRRPFTPAELAGLGGVVFDPPRAGAEAQVRAIAAARPPRVAAISCDPVTFARDLRILVDAGYQVDWALPVDQFRWSARLEAAAALSAR